MSDNCAATSQLVNTTYQVRPSRRSCTSSDVWIVLPDESWYDVHGPTLAAESSFFTMLFKYPTNEAMDDGRPVYRVRPLDHDSFKQIMEWMWSRKLMLTNDNADLIYLEADYLDCRKVLKQCVTYITRQLGPENALGIAHLARHCYNAELSSRTARYICYNFVQVAQQDEFLACDVDELEEFLGNDSLNAQEHEIWNVTVRWLRHKLLFGHNFFSRLISKIRVGLFTDDFYKYTFKVDVVEFRPYDSAAVALLKKAENYYHILYNLADWRSPIATPPFAVPRLSPDVILAFEKWKMHSPGLVESYDVRVNRWTRLTFDHTLVKRSGSKLAVVGRKVYIVGGHVTDNRSQASFSDTICFDVEQQTLTALAPMLESKDDDHCIVALNGYIYAIGGSIFCKKLNTMERYDCGSNQWSMMQPMKSHRFGAAAAAVCGKIYVAGGMDDNFRELDSVEEYSPESNEWRSVGPMSTKRFNPSCVSLHDELYILGGYRSPHYLSSCEKYNPKEGAWTTIPSMITPRSEFGAVVVDGKIMVIGGRSDRSISIDLVECFDPAKSVWYARRRYCKRPSFGASACVISGIHLSSETIMAYANPGRDKLPEEKRIIYERRRLRKHSRKT